MPVDAVLLLDRARLAWGRAYAPYSHFPVGAALLASSGTIYLGCNVENAAYPACICAERTALVSAIVAGERTFEALAIIADSPRPVPPCGTCRQTLSEFAPDLIMVLANLEGVTLHTTLAALLPGAFQASDLSSVTG
ncbi:MAG: cytidine deaminase [Herpetosiphon sp.]